jgi:hypothetical protein
VLCIPSLPSLSPAATFWIHQTRPVRLRFGFHVFEHLRVFLGCGVCIELDKSMAGWKSKEQTGMGAWTMECIFFKKGRARNYKYELLLD